MPRRAILGVLPPPRRPLPGGGRASTTASSSMESWVLAATGRQAAGCHGGPPAGGTWIRACRGLSGSGRLARPPFGTHAHRVHAGPGPVELAPAAKLIQQHVVQPLPHAGALPVAQPPPAGDRAAAAKLVGGQQPPRDPSAQLVDDARQSGPI